MQKDRWSKTDFLITFLKSSRIADCTSLLNRFPASDSTPKALKLESFTIKRTRTGSPGNIGGKDVVTEKLAEPIFILVEFANATLPLMRPAA